MSRLKLMERQARVTGERLRSLASELNLSEERTRKTLAGTLHDQVCQTLALARMRLSSARTLPKETAESKIVEEVLEMLALAIKETRFLMMEISPPVLHDLGLESAIGWIAERISSEHGINIKMINAEDFSDLKIMLYQMTKELLVNIVKHSGAHHVLVNVKRNDQSVGITVRDDGRGSDAGGAGSPTTESGFGLFSIRERLKFYNGSLRIEWQEGRGTTMSIRLPVGKKADRDWARWHRNSRHYAKKRRHLVPFLYFVMIACGQVVFCVFVASGTLMFSLGYRVLMLADRSPVKRVVGWR